MPVATALLLLMGAAADGPSAVQAALVLTGPQEVTAGWASIAGDSSWMGYIVEWEP